VPRTILLDFHRIGSVASGRGTRDAMHAGALPRINPPSLGGGNGQEHILIVLASRIPKAEGAGEWIMIGILLVLGIAMLLLHVLRP
jgi:hypothetical protein